MVWKVQRYSLIREYLILIPSPINILILLFNYLAKKIKKRKASSNSNNVRGEDIDSKAKKLIINKFLFFIDNFFLRQ